ncbi:MAG TPA: DUF3108 domain-containing protein [Gammaproteobacteria bacterium]|nr:DUF3108 domain-containing protein [Gammaproteobacteria bacterium]
MLRHPFFTLLLAAAPLIAAAAEDVVPEYTATYAVALDNSPAGTLVRTLRRDAGGSYLFESETKATQGWYSLLGLAIQEKSAWTLEAGQLRPLNYSYQQSGPGGRDLTMEFDWQKGTLRQHGGKHERDTPLVPHLLDRLLYQYALTRDLTSGNPVLDYVVAEDGKIKTYHLRRAGGETLATPLGNLETIRIERRKEDSKRMTTLWCAPALHYLPVRLDHIEKNGQQTSALIQSLSTMEPPPLAIGK